MGLEIGSCDAAWPNPGQASACNRLLQSVQEPIRCAQNKSLCAHGWVSEPSLPGRANSAIGAFFSKKVARLRSLPVAVLWWLAMAQGFTRLNEERAPRPRSKGAGVELRTGVPPGTETLRALPLSPFSRRPVTPVITGVPVHETAPTPSARAATAAATSGSPFPAPEKPRLTKSIFSILLRIAW